MKKNRRTFLDEHQTICGLSPEPTGENFRSEVGDFVINYIKRNGKSPSNSEIIANCIPKISLKDVDVMADMYKLLESDEVDYKEYIEKADERGIWD